MRYSFISAAFLALVSSVVAQTAGFDAITSPTQDQNIPAGSSFDIIWEPGTVTGTITITLLQGATATTLQTGSVIASSIDNTLGKYTWMVPSSSSYATYGFEIVLDSTAKSSSPTLQYSFPFHITGGTSSSPTGTPSTTTMHLSTGPNYSSSPVVTSTSTSSIPSSTVTVVSTSSSNSTTASATLKPTTSSNVTLSTLKTTSTKTATTSSGSSSTTTAAPKVSTNAAVSNIATGGLAVIGGIVLAFAL